ncbi:RDD family [Metamycoplasma arthritidis]|uniref:Hypothetical membrane protein n=1 Tax=Metamycoplasma arthritidis (strain 158L3-1) TaxID=243272 RepID=B3PNG6_META1|nr:RDD family protein [Metamycoplasma arthritidis]ACF07568.1 hypothetical membrane protein [Metamycoplasma arthritidis 158L3-1]VEU79076.1 RDD family [Metamycoplasma arthritidis]
MTKINKKANFWIRLLATLIDVIFFLAFAIGLSFGTFNYQKGTYYHLALYYFWLICLIAYLILFFIVIPIVWKGKTLGMAICKIKVIKQNEKDKFSKVIFDRQRLFSFLWVFVFLSFICFVSPETFLQAANIKQLAKLNKVQKAFLAIPTALSALAAFSEIFLIITNARESRVGLNDKLSSSFTVWKNKYEEVKEKTIKDATKIQPKIRKLPKITIDKQ